MKKVLFALSFLFILGLPCNTTPRMPLFRSFISKVNKGKVALCAFTSLMGYGLGFKYGFTTGNDYRKTMSKSVKALDSLKKNGLI